MKSLFLIPCRYWALWRLRAAVISPWKLLSRLNQPWFFSVSSHGRCSSPNQLGGPLLSLLNWVMPFLYWETWNWIKYLDVVSRVKGNNQFHQSTACAPASTIQDAAGLPCSQGTLLTHAQSLTVWYCHICFPLSAWYVFAYMPEFIGKNENKDASISLKAQVSNCLILPILPLSSALIMPVEAHEITQR